MTTIEISAIITDLMRNQPFVNNITAINNPVEPETIIILDVFLHKISIMIRESMKGVLLQVHAYHNKSPNIGNRYPEDNIYTVRLYSPNTDNVIHYTDTIIDEIKKFTLVNIVET